ncbi:uncharacterized protein LOC129612717 [Condylostylus longicornis]|uniref:uncharacterized protein LOC129612717 n=1 Tax=Condylostylus longicornis TaxID=2530218 RepID=UPI00244E59F2|nr:uncharacterized protein LOC129612717 [Condylostylus longicornis]
MLSRHENFRWYSWVTAELSPDGFPKSQSIEGPLIISEAVQGTLGRLPCNITPPVPEDRVALVIWYKEGHSKPIYSFDKRTSKFENGSHWVDDILGKRAFFLIAGKPAALTIRNTRSEDSGMYRCRVDFQKSPTRNSKVQLRVIIPPENLVILDDSGNHIPHYILGPYNEGASINITCVSTGGQPLPKVNWWHENTLLDDTSTILSDRRVKNVLVFEKLKREHLNMQLTCLASNNNLTTPISSTVTLDMNLRPVSVKLQGENRPLSADNSYQLSCEVEGARPAPTITWWKGSTPMKNTHEISNPEGNRTTSILTFTPTIDDRGKFLSCRAEQTFIQESGIEDGWKLDIYHIPVVSLELGTNNNGTFREGIDVFFECNIKSNPWVYKVSWRHNGAPLENNIAEGIVVANQSLVLQNVSRARSGIYTCVGSNREGDGESNAVQLDIRFAPVCRPGQRTAYSSGRQETVKVICEVEANPSEVSFVWKFNSSTTEYVDIAASLVAIDRSRSIAHYTPMTEHDYGTLLCWASNEIGDQTEPCVYTINPAGEPDPLINCTLLNLTSTSFQIECIEGFDGGLEQDFIMEVYVNGTTRNPKFFRSKNPFFEVRGLVPGVGYNVFLIAHNSKGRSNATIMQVYTLKDPEKQTAPVLHFFSTDLSLAYAPVIEDIRPFLGILIGAVGSIFLVALIIVIVVRMRGSSGRDRNNYSHQVSRDTLHNGQSVQDIRIGRDTLQTSSADSIDKNPDIIPQDDRDEDDEWTTKGNNRAYATAALAEQNAIVTSTYDRITYGLIDKKAVQNHLQQQQQQQQLQNHHHQQQQQQAHHHHQIPPPQYITTYNTLIPVSKIGYSTQPNKTELNYAELAAPQPNQRIPYCSATLGRPRQSDIKRAEPNIYSQIDLAHHPMYSTSTMYGTNATLTGVTMSHPSQLATSFPPPPPIFATSHKPATISNSTTQSSSIGSSNTSGGSSGVGGGGSDGSSNISSGGILTSTNLNGISNNNPIVGGGSIVGSVGINSNNINGSNNIGGGGSTIAIGLVSSSAVVSLPPSLSGTVHHHHPPVVVVPNIGGITTAGTIQQQQQQQGTTAVHFTDANSNTGLLKTVPEETSQINGDDTIKSKTDRNHATRF